MADSGAVQVPIRVVLSDDWLAELERRMAQLVADEVERRLRSILAALPGAGMPAPAERAPVVDDPEPYRPPEPTRRTPALKQGKKRPSEVTLGKVRRWARDLVNDDDGWFYGTEVEVACDLSSPMRKLILQTLVDEGDVEARGATRSRMYRAVRSERRAQAAEAVRNGEGTVDGRVLHRLSTYGGKTVALLMTELGLTETQARQALGRLMREGEVRPVQRGSTKVYEAVQ